MIICSKSRWVLRNLRLITSSSVRSAGAEAGSTRSMPKGLPSTRSRIHLMSAAMSSGRVHRLAEHREAAGIDHRDCNILAVREGDDRVLDAELVAELRVQRILAHFGGTPCQGGRRACRAVG